MNEAGRRGASSRTPEQRYWSANLRILAVLLSVWFVVSFGLGILFVEPLNQYSLGGFPLGFWFAQQGSIFAFIGLVLIYALWIERVERRYRAERDEQLERDRSRA
jgi:putative solute:sodium symporter small subunit